MTPASLIRVKGVFPAIGMADAGALPLLSCVQLGQFFLNHGHHFGGNLVLPFTGSTNGILRDGRDLFGQLLTEFRAVEFSKLVQLFFGEGCIFWLQGDCQRYRFLSVKASAQAL